MCCIMWRLAQVTAHGDLILIFALGSRTFKVTITRCYVIPTNLHHDLGLAPFRRSGFQKVVHVMHNKVKITLDSWEIIDLDHAKIKIISPGSLAAHSESHKIDQMVCVATHRARMNEVTLNDALTVHEKGLHSSFQSYFLLSRSGQAINMPLFPKLDLDCPTCHACKINKTTPAPGGSERTKNSVRLGRNLIKVAPVFTSKAPELASISKDSRKHPMTTRSKGFLRSRMLKNINNQHQLHLSINHLY